MTPDEIWQSVREALRPPALDPLSVWLEGNVRLPHGLSAEGGPIRLWPTQKGITDALTDPGAGTRDPYQGRAVRLHEPSNTNGIYF